MVSAFVLLSHPVQADKGNWNYSLPDWVISTADNANPQFKWDAKTGGWYFNFGPTGIRVMFDLDSPRVAKVMYVFEDSPAAGKIFKGDEILGVNGVRFTTDEPFPPQRGGGGTFALSGPRLEVAKAIEESEGNPSLNGKLTFTVKSKGKTSEVELKLKPLGYFSKTFPYNCPKSRKLAEMAGDWLVKEGNGSAKWGPRMGQHIDSAGRLALLSFGSKYRHMMKPDDRAYNSDWAPLWSWILGIHGIEIAEVQQSFNDKQLIPRLERLVQASAKKQGPAGQYSHKDYVPNGFKLAFPTGMNGLTMALAKKAGAQIDEEAYLRTRYLLTWSVDDNGGLGYGAHNEVPITEREARQKVGRINPKSTKWSDSARDNGGGRLMGGSATTTLIHFIDPMDSYSEDFVKRGVRFAMCSRWSSRHAHSCGSLTFFFCTIAASLGPVVGEEDMYREYMDDMKYWLNIARCHDGSYYFEPKIDTEMIPSERVITTSAAILMLNAPLRELYINGKGHSDSAPRGSIASRSSRSTTPVESAVTEPEKPEPAPVPLREARSLSESNRQLLDRSLLAALKGLSDAQKYDDTSIPISLSPRRVRVLMVEEDMDIVLFDPVSTKSANIRMENLKPIDKATLSILVSKLQPESDNAKAMAAVYLESAGYVKEADNYFEQAGPAATAKLSRLLR
jgi:hypothetical protein